MTAKNGAFTGDITGSTITGSTLSITSDDGCTLSIDSNGLILNAKSTSNIFGKRGGVLTIGTTRSLVDSMFSPITYKDTSASKTWTMPLADNVSRFEFSDITTRRLIITTLFGKYYVELQPV